MKRLILILAMIVTMSVSTSVALNFDSNNENWSKSEITLGTYEQLTVTQAAAAWETEADSPIDLGNPNNGYIYGTVTGAKTPRLYNLGIYREDSSNTLFGDLTGQSIQADIRRYGHCFQTLSGGTDSEDEFYPTVRWVISNATSTTSGYEEATWYVSRMSTDSFIEINDLDDNWETRSLAMTADNFFLWPNGITDGTEVSFNDLIQDNYNFVGFTILSSAADDSSFGGSYDGGGVWRLPDYGAYSTSDSSTLCIDNVAVPEPVTLALLAIGGLAMLRKRK